jgi:hypothetical protein
LINSSIGWSSRQIYACQSLPLGLLLIWSLQRQFKACELPTFRDAESICPQYWKPNFVNYLSHAYKYLHDPYFVAGTALPDWMSVIDRRNRARSQAAERVLDDEDPRVVSLARGVMQHHCDDRWFHQTAQFVGLSTGFAVELRALLIDESGHQAGFVGHIVVELLLDSVLSDDNPDYLMGYYAAIGSLDVGLVQAVANRVCSKPFEALGVLIPRFLQERFLADYTADDRLWMRLNHVMRRVGLPALPASVVAWLANARVRVREVATELLTEPNLNQP